MQVHAYTTVGKKPLLSVLLYKELPPELCLEVETEMDCGLARGRGDSRTQSATVRIKPGINPLTHNALLLLFGLLNSEWT